MAVIAIDVGGTKIKAGVMSKTGELSAIVQLETNTSSAMEQIEQLIVKVMEQSNAAVEAIGIGTAGRVGFEEGQILYSTPNLTNWAGTKVKETLQSRFHLPVVVDNDANTAAVAEGYFGAAQSARHYVCVTLGTGVGAGIVVNGSLVRGKAGAGGEIGHMQFSYDGEACNCGRKGCWEQYVSGRALEKAIERDAEISKLGITPTQLFDLYKADKQHPAKRIVEQYVAYLAAGLASLQNTIDPDCFVLGGGVIHSHEAWWDTLIEALQQYDQEIVVKKAKFDNEAGMIGAGILAYQSLGQL